MPCLSSPTATSFDRRLTGSRARKATIFYFARCCYVVVLPKCVILHFKPINYFPMAKILTTAIVADIRNKLNGSVFSKNRYGAYVRTKVTPVNPQTVYQAAARNNLATWSASWRSLDESQRQAWIAAAVNFPFTDIFGNSKILSGSALYVKLNTNIANVGGSALSDPPSPIALSPISSITLTAAETGGVVSLAYVMGSTDANDILVVDATPLINPGISFVKNKYRYLVDVASTTASPLVLTPVYAARFSAPVADQKIFVRARIVNKLTGQSGVPLSTYAIVGA